MQTVTSTYDNQGRLLTSQTLTAETSLAVQSDGQTYDHTFETDYSVQNFNGLDQATETTTVVLHDNSAPDRMVTDQRTGQTYNALGQLMSYVDTETSTAAPDRPTVTARSNIQYNAAGLAVSWTETDSSGAASGFPAHLTNAPSAADLALYVDQNQTALVSLTLNQLMADAANGGVDQNGQSLASMNLFTLFKILFPPH